MPELIMQISRNGENRLSGTVRSRQGSEPHHFSGTLELMRVFEEFVPLVSDDRPLEPAVPGGMRAPATGASEPPTPTTH